MMIFERLFAAYYFFYIWERRFNKKHHLPIIARDENFGALTLLAVAQFMLMAVIFGILKRFSHLVITNWGTALFAVLLIQGLLIFSQYQYFLSNRTRKTEIIETFRSLPDQERTFWYVVAFAAVFV